MQKQLIKGNASSGNMYCEICKQIVPTPHHCLVQVKPTPKKNKDLKFSIYYDFECSQENGIHIPNLCVAERVCQHCDRLDIDTPSDHCQATQHRLIFQGPRTLKVLMDWFLEVDTDDHRQTTYKNLDAIIIAHN
jgi:hypothetical protein